MDKDNFSSDLLRAELGIRDDTRQAGQLTTIAELSDSLFNEANSTFFGRGKQERERLDPNVLALAKLSIEAYRGLNKKISDLGGMYKDQGKFAKIVGGIHVSPIVDEGRWMVNFTTTNFYFEEDWRAFVSSFCFDFPSAKLNESYPARANHWVAGRKRGEGEFQIIGTYGTLAESYKGRLAEGLKAQGWKNIGEIWAADVDRFSGYLTPPIVNSVSTT